MAPRLRQIVRARKSDVKIGAWGSGKVPKQAFPLAKKAYGLGNSYRWCVVSFLALGLEFRVLIVFNKGKEKYEAVLGVGIETLSVLCSYEYHAGEPGWHCHAACADSATVPQGFRRGPWVRRLPAAKKTHSRLDFGSRDENEALRFAFACYNIDVRGTELSQGSLQL